jgi:small neutral amino acid transporter SnatA (MarC family)
MPVFIGPGTISASVIIGKKHDPLVACLIVIGMVLFCATVLALLKWLHDVVKPRREAIVQRYIEITGRVTALIVGTIAVDMIMRGISSWTSKF